MDRDAFGPPVAFSFKVTFEGIADPVGFQEVSGLETGLETEPLIEGGENRFVHQLPKPVKTPNLRLKRGMAPANSPLVEWCKETLEGGLAEAIKPRALSIALCDENGDAVAGWKVGQAYPVKWQVSGFDAMTSEHAIEVIELAYQTLTRK